MLGVARTLLVAAGLAGGAVTSQAPEFTQQYRQRIGGALEELRQVVSDFDADASNHDLSRAEALSSYRASANKFLHDRGVSMAQTIHRYESLVRQSARLDNWPEPARPLVLVGEIDSQLVRGAWTDFKPGVPVTVAGAAWAAIGFLLVYLLAYFGGKAGTGIAGAARRRGLPATRERGAAYHPAVAEAAPEVMPDPEGPIVDDGRHFHSQTR